MKGDKFDIVVTKWGDAQKYRMNVEIVYHSEQLIRFKLSAGVKYMHMEKHLMKKTNQWKLGGMNYKLTGDPKEIAGAVLNIQKELDNYMSKNKPIKN